MTHSFRRFILVLTASAIALTLLITSRVSTAQTGVTWTGLSGASTSGSGLTPTASNGRGESSQSIPAGNGSLKVFAYSSGGWGSIHTSFGLTNAATFTGATSEIDYGWLTYGTAASCRKNGVSIDGLLHTINSGDSMEVRINGTTIEYYHNSSPVSSCTLTGETIGYPYRAAAVFTDATAPSISSATMTGMDNLISPTSLAATNGSGNDVSLSWSYAGTGQTGFKIERKLGKAGTYSQIATVGSSTLTYSDTDTKTANRVYAYRVRAYKTTEDGPYSNFAQATTPYTGSGSIKTDRAVHTEPTPPPLPHAGGKWRDEVFGTEILRATDDDDCPAGGGTWYNQWPTFNADQTKILIRCGGSGDMMIKTFDAATFTVGPVILKTWGGGDTQVNSIGGEYAQWQGATWSRTDPNKLWVVPAAANSGGSTTRGPQIYTYSTATNQYTLVKSFVSTFTSGQYFFEYHFAGTHSDGDYDVFTASVNPEQNGSAAHWLAWRRTGDSVIFNHDNAYDTHYNVCIPTKDGSYIYCGPDFGSTNRKIYRTSDLAEQSIPDSEAMTHGDVGTTWAVGRHYDSPLDQRRRTVSDWNNTELSIFDWKDVSGDVDSSNDCHTGLAADNEDWVMEGCYDDPNYNTSEEAWRETGAFEDEIMQLSLDGSQRIRRLVHHRSLVDNLSDSTGYWAAPKPTISSDGRFIAFTSNWENSGRTDLFIIRIPRAPVLTFEDNFNDNSLDAKKWVKDALGSAAADPNVTVNEQNQRLEITPLSNTSGAHSNGYSTANPIDMTNRRAKVEVVQATNSSGYANTVFSLAADNGWYRFLTEHGQLYMEQYISGTGSSGATPITYNATTHRHWRIRHDPSTDTIYWETSSDGSTWTVRHSATRQLDITRLFADLYVRTWQSESSPGVAYFDNFKFEANP